MDDAHIDFETSCAAELTGTRAVGVHKYVEHETFRIWLFSWRIGNVGPVNRYYAGGDTPTALLDHIRSGGTVVAHNAMFERVVWEAMRQVYGLHDWPELKAEQQRDTMAVAMSMNLPAALDKLGDVLKLSAQKDEAGKKLMLSLAKPHKDKQGQYSWPLATPENLSRLGDYCDDDIRAETEADLKLGSLPPDEQRIWVLDQVINDRGIPIDLPSCMRAVDLVELAKARAKQRMKELTNGAVTSYTQVQKIAEWINAQGIECTAFTKGEHENLIIMSELYDKPDVQKVIKLRQGAAKTSVAKFIKFVECCCADNRIRGQLQFDGATQTGRWAGRLVQPQNLRRLDWENDEDDITLAIEYLTTPLPTATVYELFCYTYGEENVLDILSKCLRPMIIAEEGNVLYGADFSNIEGRIAAWLAGEHWKIHAFTAYDNGTGPDLYKLAYAKAFGVDVSTVGKGPQRQIGKVQELALGYQGGVGSYISMGANYGVKPFQLVEPVKKAAGAEMWEKVIAEYKGAPDKRGLPADQWAAIKIIVRGWRSAHPKIVQSWRDLEDAVIQAVSMPGVHVPVLNGRVWYYCDGKFLLCRLPSGRVISYPSPWLKWEETEEIKVGAEWRNVDEFFEFEIEQLISEGCEYRKRGKNVVYFMGIDAETKQWRAHSLYGGHEFENIVQATAACIQRVAIEEVENAGYPVIMHTHDEVVAEAPEWYGSEDDYKSVMKVYRPWMEGLPMAVSAFKEKRYVK